MKYIIALCAALFLPFAAQAHPESVHEYKAAFHTMHKDMDITYTGKVDNDFTRGMIPHHQGAVDMAKVVLKHGKDPDIRELAEWIINIQNQEIAWMNHWLTRFPTPRIKVVDASKHPAVQEFQDEMNKMHREMDIVFTSDADIDFAMGMIPHHQAAIDMAYTQLRHGKNPELSELSRGIIVSQNSEIAMMKRWLKRQGIDFETRHAEYMAQKKGKHSSHH